MSRANETTQVDYSLLDDTQLGDAVAERVLGCQRDQHPNWHGMWLLPESQWDKDPHEHITHVYGIELVNWWGAGLVIDKMWRDFGYGFILEAIPPRNPAAAFADFAWEVRESPIRAILVSALRAKEAE